MKIGIIFLVAISVMILSQLLQQSKEQKSRHQEIMKELSKISGSEE